MIGVRTLFVLAVLAAAVVAGKFKPLRLPKPAKLEKQVDPLLPKGIVITAAPFDAVIERLLEPHESRYAERKQVLSGLTGSQIPAAFKVLAKENANLRKRIAAVEEGYAEVYDRGYMESSEGARRARKRAAVLIPFYRTLLRRNRELAADALTGKDAASLVKMAVSGPDPGLRIAAARALGRAGGAEALAALKAVVLRDKEPTVRVAALSEALAFKVAEVQDIVLAALQDTAFQVRALAIAVCVRAKLVAAAGALIAALEKERGRLRRDIDEAGGHPMPAPWRKKRRSLRTPALTKKCSARSRPGTKRRGAPTRTRTSERAARRRSTAFPRTVCA